MYYILRYKIALYSLLLFSSYWAVAQQQMNMRDYDVKRLIHFGITLGYNTSDFKIIHSQSFLYNDSVLVAESQKSQGFNLGIISDLHLDKHWDLRFIPTLTFAEKKLRYIIVGDDLVFKTIESVYLDFPLLAKFKSDRIQNFRMYLIGGLKYAVDMASNAEARNAPDIVKVNRTDFTLDYGFGFDFYFPMFKFAPELKVSHGLINVLTPDNRLIYARVLDKLFTRTFMITLNFE